MKNKGGQIQYIAIGAIVLTVIFFFVGKSIGYDEGFSEAQSVLFQELESQKLSLRGLENQLVEKETYLDYTLEELDICTQNLEDINNELNNYDPGKTFPLFWLTEITINKFWAVIINISLAIFSFSFIRVIIKFGGKKK